MKIRNGFVSNSSSSSFLIYGAELSKYRDKLLEKLQVDENYDLCDKLENEFELFASSGADGDSLYVGRTWSSVADNETGLEFKGDVQRKLNDLIGEEIECHTCSEAWYNG